MKGFDQESEWHKFGRKKKRQKYSERKILKMLLMKLQFILSLTLYE
jgi:hypothetical protein